MKWFTSILLACLPLGVGALLVSLEGPVRAQDTGLEAEGEDAEDAWEQASALRSVPIEDVAWMAGVWRGNGLGGKVEEHWMPAKGGSMTGMFRLLQDDKVSFHQFMLVEEERDEMWLRMHHVNPGFTFWEKQGPLSFRLIEMKDGDKAVFESPDPKQAPSRVTYWAVGENGLGIRIESPNAPGGPLTIEALYKRSEN